MMKPKTALIFFMMFITSCRSAAMVEQAKTVTPSETIVPSNTITPTHTPTFIPVPPTLTFTPTPIPTMDGGYPVAMQIAIFNPYIDEYWPGRTYSITKTIFNGKRYIFVGPKISVVGKNEYLYVEGISWSPNGKYFLYAGSNTENIFNSCLEICEGVDVWVVSNDGKYKKLLSAETKFLHRQISWDSSATKFITLSESTIETQLDEREFCIIQIPGGNVVRTGNFGKAALYSPTNDTYIYNTENSHGDFEFFVVDENNPTPQKILTYKPTIHTFGKPDFLWSPDGKYLYSVQINEGMQNALFRIQPDGTREELTVLKGENFAIESISPNGSYILLCDALTYPHECIVFNVDLSGTQSIPPAQYYMPFWLLNNDLESDGYVFNIEEGGKEETPDSFSFEENHTIHYFNLNGLFISPLP